MCFRCDNTQSAGARQWNIDSLQLRFRSPLAMQIGYSLRSRTLYFFNNYCTFLILLNFCTYIEFHYKNH